MIPDKLVTQISGNSPEDKTILQTVMDTVLDGLIIIDSRGFIDNVNLSVLRIFGYERQEIIGQNIKILMPEPYHSEHDSYLENYHRTGERKIIGIGREVTAKRKDGRVFPMSLGINEMTIDGECMFVGTLRDISQQKKLRSF